MLTLAYRSLFPALWLGWAICWWVLSKKVNATVRHEPATSRLLHILPLVAALMLLWVDKAPGRFLNVRLLPWAPWEFWVAAAVTTAGFGFAVWARLHIGRNWSGTVTLKENHELITTGPYAIVRHPIYTGLLLAVVGSALARGEWRGVVAVLVTWLALWRKFRLEEAWMLELFGEQYAAYRRRVPALVPFSRR